MRNSPNPSQRPRSGGELLVETLLAYGVSHAFCVPGESYLGALDAFYARRDAIRLITCRQEGGATYMAEAYAKLRGEPGVALVSRGPGAANAMVGIHTAYQDSTPLLLIIGQVARAELGREAFQELDYGAVYGGVAKAVLKVGAASEVARRVCEAWQLAISDRPGPVVLECPEDVLREPAVATIPPKPRRQTAKPTARQLAHFKRLLNRAQRPLLIFGGAAWTPATNTALAQFAAKHAIPAACGFRRQDMLDNTLPHYAGELGNAVNPNLVERVREADLIIALATRLGDITTRGYGLFADPDFPPEHGQRLVHIFPEKCELNRVYRAELAIACAAHEFLASVADLPATRSESRAQRVAAARQSYLAHIAKSADPDARLCLAEVMAHLRQTLSADAIITCGAGNYTVWAQRNYQFRRPKTQLGSSNGSMGYAVPAAVAAKLLRPDSTVLSFSGDGCFLMNGQELATAVQYRLNILFLVINNACYGSIRSHQQMHYPNRAIATALRNPDFAALAQSYGAFGEVVTETAQFAPAFQRARNAHRPALLELRLAQSSVAPDSQTQPKRSK